MKRIQTSLAVIAALICCSCAKKITIDGESQEFMGSWIGSIELSSAEIAEAKRTMNAESFSALQGVLTIEFELLGDGTYRMSMSTMKVPFEDTWYLDGNTLTLASSGVSGESSDSGDESSSNLREEDMVPNKVPMFLGVEADGEELVWRNGAQNTESRFVFKRK